MVDGAEQQASRRRAASHRRHDGLCGLYAIIKAVRVAVDPELTLSNRVSNRLFECGLILLSRKRKL